jgi:hypothetical protein
MHEIDAMGMKFTGYATEQCYSPYVLANEKCILCMEWDWMMCVLRVSVWYIKEFSWTKKIIP